MSPSYQQGHDLNAYGPTFSGSAVPVWQTSGQGMVQPHTHPFPGQPPENSRPWTGSGMGVHPPDPRLSTAPASAAGLEQIAPLAMPFQGSPLRQAPRTTHGTAKLHFDASVTDANIKAFFSQLRKGVPWFPKNLRDVRVSTPASLPGGSSGISYDDPDSYLQTGDPKLHIQVAVNPLRPMTHEYLANLGYDFLHELGDHILNSAVSFSKHHQPLPEIVDHFKLFVPSDETNGWHQLVKSALRFVPEPLKIPFLVRYAKDVEGHCCMDYDGRDDDKPGREYCRGDNDIFDAGMAWADKLKDKAQNPHDPFWSYSGPATLRRGYSSGEDELPAFRGESNPMKTTKSDLEEAIDYENTMANRSVSPSSTGV